MIKLKKILKENYILFGIPKKGVGAYEYDIDMNELKQKIDKLGYKGRYSNEDMIPNEDYVIEKNNRAIRLYSNKIKSDFKLNELFKDFHLTIGAK
jgi:hypothetical protein